MREQALLKPLTGWFGREVVSREGAPLGRLEGIVYDYVTSQPVWLVVVTGALGVSHVLVPAEAFHPGSEGLRSEFTEEVIRSQPHANLGAGFDSQTEQQELCEHLGLQFQPDRDLRVLREGDELPGQEVTMG